MQGVYIKENSPKNKPTVVRSSITNLLYGVYIIQCCISLHVHEDEGLLSQVKTQVVHLWVIWKECVILSNTNELLPWLCTYMQAGKALGSPSHMKHFILKTTFPPFGSCVYIATSLIAWIPLGFFMILFPTSLKIEEKFPVHFSNLLPGGIKVKIGIQPIQPCWK